MARAKFEKRGGLVAGAGGGMGLAIANGLIEGGAREVVFVVGGPDGLSAEILEASRYRMSLSPMTLPHELAEVVLLEQLYRALTRWKGLPYHR